MLAADPVGVVRLLIMAAVAVAVVLVVLAAGVMLGRAAARRERRGGLLELDTWEARNAIAMQEAERPPNPVYRSPRTHEEAQELFDRTVSALRKCNPARGVHFHGPGDRCECGERPSTVPPEPERPARPTRRRTGW